jgi:ribonuclease inhibitor
MHAELDGKQIASDADFHSAIAAALPFPHFYGRNLDALSDVVTGMLERPIVLIWKNSKISSAAMPERFDAIVQVLQDAEHRDRQDGRSDRFELRLE